MLEKKLNQTICLKQYISEKEYKEINQLDELCCSQDKTNLKLELDYKLNMRRNSEIGLKDINEFLYYVEDILVGYLGISSYGGSNIGEINGMVHPDFRRKGLFKKLFKLAIDECKKRSFDKLLLLTDGKSNSGVEFINTVHGKYDFSEYRMKLLNKPTSDSIKSINLRKAGKLDGKEIAKQNAVFFNHSEEYEWFPVEEGELNEITYMVELKETVIGKIRVEYSNNSAFLCGFGILPDFRGKGYGKAALKEALHLINEKNIYETELDVECKNNNALNLYKACGFEEKSVMNYYKYNI
ncbi:GNAT family N-acetyltransferase [Clostridium sediminicola]|uniref:GNAT family N-acetyltransferase n=1 Tax=Clostridium sediminicola TaxID=3114879 RepID=UPI0031F1E3C6